MKRHLKYKYTLVFMAVLLGRISMAQETKLSKKIDRTFEVSERVNLEVTNKYGSIIVDTWPRNEVSLKIEMQAFGKDENAAEKLMDRVEFDFKQSSDFLEIESVFDRRKSFLKDLLNTVGDYSASLLSKHKLQINYELQIPESASSITITNRFGDVHMSDVRGRLDLTISHGDLRINKIEDYSRINLNYGKAKIKDVNDISLSMKGAELEAEYIEKLDLRSSSSKIRIEHVSVADIESTNDEIEIIEIQNISGSANFTEVSISSLQETCRLNQNYGELTIRNVYEFFRTIRLDGKSTDYELSFTKNTSFEARVYARDDKLTIAEFPGKREKRYLDDKGKFVQITGFFGVKETPQKLDIDAQNGEVAIYFKNTPPETYNK